MLYTSTNSYTTQMNSQNLFSKWKSFSQILFPLKFSKGFASTILSQTQATYKILGLSTNKAMWLE